jgi:hypothetical protein
MARFLFICGGTGKQIVVDRSLMNFDGFMQIDVDSEVVKNVNDPRTQVMSLPLEEDNATTTTQALQTAEDEYLNEHDKLDKKLVEMKQNSTVQQYIHHLQQAGFAEKFKKYLADVDQLAYYEGSPDPVRTFRDENSGFIKLHEHDAHVQQYLQLQRQIEELEKRLLAVQAGMEGGGLGDALLVHGMAQRPLIGSAYFSRSYVQGKFNNQLQSLIDGRPVTQGDQIELWIVSSMCGGTGQGISYHVAEYAREFFVKKGFASIVVHFVRLGSVTYTRYGTQDSVLENCAMATLHDAAFSYGVRAPLSVPFLLNEVGARRPRPAGTQYNFYYLELEDYVNQDRKQLNDSQWQALLASAAKKRSADLASALRAITQPTVQASFNTAFVNVRPGWHRALYVRNGVWEKGVDANGLYDQSARQVSDIVDAELLSPDYPGLDNKYVHQIDANQALTRWVENQGVTEQVEPKQLANFGNRPKQWSLPSYAHTYRKSGNNQREQDVTDYLRSNEWANAQREIGRVMNLYLGDRAVDSFAVYLSLGEANTETPTLQRVQFDPQIADKKTPRYIEELKLAHQVVAKIDRILSRNSKDENGSLKQLHTLWQPIIPGWAGGNAYANRLRSEIKPFMQALVTVQALLKLRAEALNRIIDARDWLSPLNTRLQKDLANIQENPQLTQIRQLHVNVDKLGATWLSWMAEEAKRLEAARAVNVTASDDAFRESVVWGSQGLTEAGVKFVLGLPTQATDSDIANELAQHCGRTPEGIWWQRQVPAAGNRLAMADFKYVIFPNIDDDLKDRIKTAKLNANLELPQLIVSDDEYTGLKILALQTYRGTQNWFPSGTAGAAGVGSAFYQQLVSYLAPKQDEPRVDRYHRIAVASTGHPIFTSDHVHRMSQDSLRDRFSERSER